MGKHNNVADVTVVTKDKAGSPCTTYSHPAFGLINKNVYTGKTSLFGSSLEMDEVYAITINTASHECSPYSETYQPEDNVVKVLLSKQQWADFITTSNSGVGTPCTLKYMRTGDMVQVPSFEDVRYNAEDHYKKVKIKAQEATERLKALNAKLMEEINGKASKTRLREIQSQINIEVQNLPSNLAFTVQVAEEVMTDVANQITFAARSKIENYAQAHGINNTEIEDVGLKAITLNPSTEN